MPAEIRFLHNYDQARAAMKAVVDLPNRHADLFVKLCLQNNNKLSKAKRGLEEFQELTEEEIQGLEEVVAAAFAPGKEVHGTSKFDRQPVREGTSFAG